MTGTQDFIYNLNQEMSGVQIIQQTMIGTSACNKLASLYVQILQHNSRSFQDIFYTD